MYGNLKDVTQRRLLSENKTHLYYHYVSRPYLVTCGLWTANNPYWMAKAGIQTRDNRFG